MLPFAYYYTSPTMNRPNHNVCSCFMHVWYMASLSHACFHAQNNMSVEHKLWIPLLMLFSYFPLNFCLFRFKYIFSPLFQKVANLSICMKLIQSTQLFFIIKTILVLLNATCFIPKGWNQMVFIIMNSCVNCVNLICWVNGTQWYVLC